MAMKELLNRLATSLQKMEGGEEDSPSDDAPVEMTEEQFVEHVTSELEKAATESGDARKHRIAYVKQIVADVAKNYEGPTKGAISIPLFKSPDQITPQSSSQGATAQPEASNYSANDAPQAAAGGAGNTPPGGTMPMGSNNASSGSTTFSKAIERIESLLKGEGEKPAADAGDAPAASGDAPAASADGDDKEPTQKSDKGEDRLLWPLDMNSPMGREEGAGDTEWGLDPQGIQAPAAE